MSDKKINNFELALKLRDLEISQLTQRNNFFMIFQGVLFAGLIQSNHENLFISVMVCLIGFILSIFQVGMASGAKFWQEYWEQMVFEFEKKERDGEAELFHDRSTEYKKTVITRMETNDSIKLVKCLVNARYSVSKIPIYTAISFIVVWLFILLYFLFSSFHSCT